MEKAVPIETNVGVLNGRDCIFLDTVVQEEHNGTLVFKGDINGNLIEKAKGWMPYTLTFTGVLACFYCELDTYNNLINTNELVENSSFDLMENSVWLKSLPVRDDYDKSKYKHYRLFTYDVVYDIIATEHTLDI